MRKIIFLFFVAFSAAMSVTSCLEPEFADNGGNGNADPSEETVPGTKTVCVSASYEGNAAPSAASVASKTKLDAVADGATTAKVLWEENDAVSFYLLDGSKRYDVSAEGSGSTVNFLFSMDEPAEDASVLAVYPKSSNFSFDAEELYYNLPSEQILVMGGLPTWHSGNNAYESIAASVADAGNARDLYDGKVAELTFRNLFGMMKYDLASSLAGAVKKISFKGRNNETLAGKFEVGADATITFPGSGEKEVVMRKADDAALETGLHAHFMLPSQTLSSGFDFYFYITFPDGTERTISKGYKNSFTIERSYMYDINTFDTGTVYEWKWGKYRSDGSLGSNDYRNLAIDKDYVYLVLASATGQVNAINLSNGGVTAPYVSGFSDGTHSSSDANVIYSSDGTAHLLTCNLALAGQDLKIYSTTGSTTSPTALYSYTVPENTRLGDKFSVEGTWESGKLYFFNYINTSGKARNVYVFTITGGKISADPASYDLPQPDQLLAQSSSSDNNPDNIGGLYKYPYSSNEYVWAGANGGMVYYTFDGSKFTQDAVSNTYLYETGKFKCFHAPMFFNVLNRKYMAFVETDTSSSSYNKSYLRIFEITAYSSLKDVLTDLKSGEAKFSYPLHSKDGNTVATTANSNAAGDVGYCLSNGILYVASCVPGAGVILTTVDLSIILTK